jgi:methylaspartate ammonia-lyase
VSLNIPLRIPIKQNGTIVGYVEALDFTSVTVTGPVAHVASGGGGGDAATLQGHPASFFATAADLALVEADVASLMDRAAMWAALGVAVQVTPPATGITYAQWLAGQTGNWAWIELP